MIGNMLKFGLSLEQGALSIELYYMPHFCILFANKMAYGRVSVRFFTRRFSDVVEEMCSVCVGR